MENINRISNVETGRAKEAAACKYLEVCGMKIIDKNYRIRQGEIDIIGIHEGCLVFVEVKYRKNQKSGAPEDAVGTTKQQKICRASDYYRMRHPNLYKLQVRYDVLAICGEEVRWYKNAFPYRTINSKTMW